MTIDALIVRKALVLSSALIYWSGVCLHARRLRRNIGRSPNVKPRGTKELILWAGWFFVVAGWISQPLLVGPFGRSALFSLSDHLTHSAWIFAGFFLAVFGHIGTLWCYSALGDSWRMGVDRGERTALVKHGPYRFVRHPIYVFQIVILAGMFFLLPSPISGMLIGVHLICVYIKALDEEAYLTGVHGPDYIAYLGETGRLFPKWRSLKSPFVGSRWRL